ncbi:MAG: hypothetical protein J6R40_04195 [Clostridia bacterium]|nr:hypothetical protein [Clostridia bacterium]
MWLLLDDDVEFAKEFRQMLLRISIFAEVCTTESAIEDAKRLSPSAVFVLRPHLLLNEGAFLQAFYEQIENVPLLYVGSDKENDCREPNTIPFSNHTQFIKEAALFFARRFHLDITKTVKGLWQDDLLGQTAFYSRTPLPLSRTQYRIFRYLLLSYPKRVPMKELAYFTLMRGEDASSRSNIATQIASLNRAALPIAGKKAVIFEKDGYILQI